jgi:hypothetical protein
VQGAIGNQRTESTPKSEIPLALNLFSAAAWAGQKIAMFSQENRAENTSKTRSRELIVMVPRFLLLKQAPSQKMAPDSRENHTEMGRNVPKKN